MINKKYKPGVGETGCLVFNLLTYKLFTGVPSAYTEGGCAAYISAFVSAAVSIAVIYAVLGMYGRTETDSISEVAEKKLGAFGRYAVFAFIAVYCAVSFVFALRELTGLVKLLAFPTAPEWFVAGFFVLAVMLALTRGTETIIRAHGLIVPIALCVTVLMLASVLRSCETDNIFPIWGNGTARIFGGAFKGLAMYSDIILIFLINPRGADRKELARSAKGATVAAAALNVAFVLIYTAMVYVPTSAGADYLAYRILKEVYYGRFFRRTDAVYMLTAALCGMLYLSFVIGIFSDTAERVFKAEGRVLAVPLIIALYLAALCTSLWGESAVAEGVIFFGGAVPILLLAVTVASAALRRKDGRE